MMCHHTSLAPESSKGVVTRAGVHDFGVNLRAEDLSVQVISEKVSKPAEQLRVCLRTADCYYTQGREHEQQAGEEPHSHSAVEHAVVDLDAPLGSRNSHHSVRIIRGILLQAIPN